MIVSTTIKDCKVQTFRSGGPGGQHQNKTNTGVRIIHEPSGAVGISREERSQLLNKRKAFRRMAESKEYKIWVHKKIHHTEDIEKWVEEQVKPSNLKIEYMKGNKYYPVP
jgi:protein subunit release factor B